MRLILPHLYTGEKRLKKCMNLLNVGCRMEFYLALKQHSLPTLSQSKYYLTQRHGKKKVYHDHFFAKLKLPFIKMELLTLTYQKGILVVRALRVCNCVHQT